MEKFQLFLPENFYCPIPKVVNTMADAKKHMKIDENNLINQGAIYTHVMAQQNSSRQTDIKKFMPYELSSVPTAFFEEQGEMRITKAKVKATLKNVLRLKLTENKTQMLFSSVAVLFFEQYNDLEGFPQSNNSSTTSDRISSNT